MWTPNKNNVWSLSLAVLNPRVCYEYDGHVRKLLFSTTNGMFKHGNLGHFSHFPLNTCPLYLVSWVGRPTRSYFPQETIFFSFLKTLVSVLLWQLFLEVTPQVSRSCAPCSDLEPWRTQLTLPWLLGESSVKWWSPIWFLAKFISGSEGARDGGSGTWLQHRVMSVPGQQVGFLELDSPREPFFWWGGGMWFEDSAIFWHLRIQGWKGFLCVFLELLIEFSVFTCFVLVPVEILFTLSSETFPHPRVVACPVYSLQFQELGIVTKVKILYPRWKETKELSFSK